MLQAGRYCWAVPLRGTNTTIVFVVLSVTSFRVAFQLFIVKAGAASSSSPYHQLHKHRHGCIDCLVESNPPNTSHISNSTHLIHAKPCHSLCCSTWRLRTRIRKLQGWKLGKRIVGAKHSDCSFDPRQLDSLRPACSLRVWKSGVSDINKSDSGVCRSIVLTHACAPHRDHPQCTQRPLRIFPIYFPRVFTLYERNS